jgi:hypothetical protein
MINRERSPNRPHYCVKHIAESRQRMEQRLCGSAERPPQGWAIMYGEPDEAGNMCTWVIADVPVWVLPTEQQPEGGYERWATLSTYFPEDVRTYYITPAGQVWLGREGGGPLQQCDSGIKRDVVQVVESVESRVYWHPECFLVQPQEL